MDISGSMGSGFVVDDDEKKDKRSNQSKLEVAKHALYAILEQLGDVRKK